MLKIDSRPVLPDRLQLIVTPDIKELLYEDEKGKLNIRNNINDEISKNLSNNAKVKGYKRKPVYDDKSSYKKKHYEFLIPSQYDYITKIYLDCWNVFHIALTVNVIRYIRSILKSDPERYDFDMEYDEKIKLDDDNFLNKQNWKGWNDALIGQWIDELHNHILDIANQIMYEIYPLFDYHYCNITVKEIEMNQDVYVGKNNSLTIMSLILHNITNKRGKKFTSDLEVISSYSRVPKVENDKGITLKQKNACHSVQFQIGNSLYYKLYRKDKDHIRAEITAKNKFVKNRFEKKYVYDFDNNLKKIDRSCKLEKILPAMKQLSKDIFKESKLNDFINNLVEEEKKLLDQHRISKLYDFLDQSEMYELMTIIDSVLNDMPIPKRYKNNNDEKVISYMRRNKEMKKNFYRKYDKKGNYDLIYDPKKAMKKRQEMINKRYAKPEVWKVKDYHEQDHILRNKQKNLQKSVINQKRKLARTMYEVDKYGLPNSFHIIGCFSDKEELKKQYKIEQEEKKRKNELHHDGYGYLKV